MTQPAQGLASLVTEAERRLEGYCSHLECCGFTAQDVRDFVRELVADMEGPLMAAFNVPCQLPHAPSGDHDFPDDGGPLYGPF